MARGIARTEARSPGATEADGPSVTAVVVSFNARNVLRTCLSAIRGLTTVIVVDNASTDGSADVVREFPDVRLVALEENMGFGTAANIGLRASRSRYVLLLNPDAWPLDDGVERLVRVAEETPRGALFGPRLVYASGRRQRSVIRHPGPLALLGWIMLPHVGSRMYDAWRGDSRSDGVRPVRPPEFVQGAAVLIRREAVEELGGFDERFFMFNEDVDLCFRLWQAGWQVVFVPSASFVHVGGVSTAAAGRDMFREHLRTHVSLVAKHDSIDRAEKTRRALVLALLARYALRRRDSDRHSADWLASVHTSDLTRRPD